MNQTIGVAKAKAQFSELIDRMHLANDPSPRRRVQPPRREYRAMTPDTASSLLGDRSRRVPRPKMYLFFTFGKVNGSLSRLCSAFSSWVRRLAHRARMRQRSGVSGMANAHSRVRQMKLTPRVYRASGRFWSKQR
jgi:hypothetical protein